MKLVNKNVKKPNKNVRIIDTHISDIENSTSEKIEIPEISDRKKSDAIKSGTRTSDTKQSRHHRRSL
jgi:hypothetical protein